VVDKNYLKIIKHPPFSGISITKDKLPLNKARLLAPAKPTKIILVGLNYKDHANELKMPVPSNPIIFLKPPSTLIGTNDNIIYPHGVKRLDYEAELALIIKKKANNIPENKVDEYILGYTCLNDITARDLQKKDTQWTRAKSFDTFCPCGPWIETEINPGNLKIKSLLNSKIRQNSNTANFIFSVPQLVCFISKIMTLSAGDIISTGTPAGIGPMQPNDTVQIIIQGIGKLKNKIIKQPPW
jgi:2-keto-4-pentenoate hydratase/2-oxohepta-3-ene-1,7-dioic acid hydratase in catechol pathway